MKKTTLLKTILILTLTVSFWQTKAQNVLIIHDDTSSTTNSNTVSLNNALIADGLTASYSEVYESLWDNTNPSIDSFDAVIHINGSTYTTEMPSAGQLALKDFVETKSGKYISFEWNAYQVDDLTQMQDMVDLVLFTRTSGSIEDTFTLTVNAGQSTHYTMAGVPNSFDVITSLNLGGLRTFSTNPSVSIMDIGTESAVAVRDFGNGHILGFSAAANYQNSEFLSNENIHKIIINFIKNDNSSVGIKEQNLNSKFFIYPNPATDFIQVSNITAAQKYTVNNILGEEIKKGTIAPNDKIDIKDFSNGVYFLKFENGNTFKFIKN